MLLYLLAMGTVAREAESWELTSVTIHGAVVHVWRNSGDLAFRSGLIKLRQAISLGESRAR
jgi:hypothetical protein